MPSKDDDKLIARGATLYGKNKEAEEARKRYSKKPRKKYDEEFFASRRPKDEHNLKYIIELVESKGMKLNFYKDKYIIRRTRSRISRTKAETYKEYLEILKNNPKELDELRDALSINVTRFFRDNDSWDELRDVIIPAIVEEKRKLGQSKIYIWSAGCAVGAEPYSLSIVCDSGKFRDMNFTIYASDINEDLLKIARNGVYDESYLDEMNKSEVLETFSLVSRGTYAVKPRIKKRVNFSQLDLTKDPFPKQLDLILCRNVMIYLTREAQDVIKSKFINSLNPRGYLLLGRTETLSGKWRDQLESKSARHRIYQKKVIGSDK